MTQLRQMEREGQQHHTGDQQHAGGEVQPVAGLRAQEKPGIDDAEHEQQNAERRESTEELAGGRQVERTHPAGPPYALRHCFFIVVFGLRFGVHRWGVRVTQAIIALNNGGISSLWSFAAIP